MGLGATLGALALDAVTAVFLGWTAWTAFKSREQPSAEPFIALLSTLTLWAVFSFGAELPGPSGGLLSTIFSLGQWGAAIFVPGIWLVYALSYTGRGTGLTWKRIALLAGIGVPVLLSGIVIAIGPLKPVVDRLLASLLGTELLYLFVLYLYATYLVLDLARSHARVSKSHVAILVVGVSAPYLSSVVGNNTALPNSTAIGLLLSGGLLAVAVRRYPVMTGFPKADYVARTRVVETLQEAVVVLDWDDHILDVNDTATEVFDSSGTAMIGKPIRSVVDGLGETDLPVGTTGTVGLQTSKGRRTFQFSVSAVTNSPTDERANPVARTVLFRDVTDQQTREQRLTVLNRILRHNVRNDLDVVLAYADHIDDEEVRSGIRESTTDLLDLSKKAREAEEVMTASTKPPEPVDLSAVAKTVIDQFRGDDRPADLSLDGPDELVITSHRSVIRQVLTELVDNAITHTVDCTPRVRVTIREGEAGAAEIVVRDNGPGLPERERQLLETGTETQLEHGRGIGLWFVNWAIAQLGGDLQLQDNEWDGSIVTIRLYDITP
ncbi:MAG: ATP-binding protein [Haloplanus sp.]